MLIYYGICPINDTCVLRNDQHYQICNKRSKILAGDTNVYDTWSYFEFGHFAENIAETIESFWSDFLDASFSLTVSQVRAIKQKMGDCSLWTDAVKSVKLSSIGHSRYWGIIARDTEDDSIEQSIGWDYRSLSRVARDTKIDMTMDDAREYVEETDDLRLLDKFISLDQDAYKQFPDILRGYRERKYRLKHGMQDDSDEPFISMTPDDIAEYCAQIDSQKLDKVIDWIEQGKTQQLYDFFIENGMREYKLKHAIQDGK